MSEATSAVMVIRLGSKFLTVPHLDGACCPGGKREATDKTTEQTAIRETMEEAGFIIKKCVFVFRAHVGEHLCDCYYATEWVDASNAKDGSELWHLARWLTRDELVSRKPGEVRFPDWNEEMLRRIVDAGLALAGRVAVDEISDMDLRKLRCAAPFFGNDVACELAGALQIERVLRKRVTRYEFGPLALERRSNSEDSWAICSGGNTVWTRAGNWEHEPLPSSRDPIHLMRARWTFEEALRELRMRHLSGEPALGRLFDA
jgi:ADP-ribose pyrophosphatase YjhB (NUDIX family)